MLRIGRDRRAGSGYLISRSWLCVLGLTIVASLPHIGATYGARAMMPDLSAVCCVATIKEQTARYQGNLPLGSARAGRF